MTTKSPVAKLKSSGGKSAKASNTVITPKAGKLVVSVGTVSVQIAKPTLPEVRRNVKAGQDALSRAGQVFIKPGVKLIRRAGVPLYYADPDNPDRLIREVNGKKVSGTFKGSTFSPAKAKTKAVA